MNVGWHAPSVMNVVHRNKTFAETHKVTDTYFEILFWFHEQNSGNISAKSMMTTQTSKRRLLPHQETKISKSV